MIQSFADADTERFYSGRRIPKWQAIRTVVERKLAMVDAAAQLKDLGSPPGNRLEALSGNRAGQHSVRINDQWRICFRWTAAGPVDVEICDYH